VVSDIPRHDAGRRRTAPSNATDSATSSWTRPGIRRARLLKDDVDHVSVVQARRSIDRADVVLLVVDAGEGFREMDATIAGYAQESLRGVVIVANKWDRRRLEVRAQRAATSATCASGSSSSPGRPSC